MPYTSPTSPDELTRQLPAFAARLGLTFRDLRWLQEALVHKSYTNEDTQTTLADNQRLEFLGDAVLYLLAAEWLHERLPLAREGTLTELRTGIVRNERLATFAEQFELGTMLLMGKGEVKNEGRKRPRNLSSAFEAILAALYLDQGLAAVRQFLRPLFEATPVAALHDEGLKDPRSTLQEWVQRRWGVLPEYREVAIEGSEHAPEFTCHIFVQGEFWGAGKGRSKQAAAMMAAKPALAALQLRDSN